MGPVGRASDLGTFNQITSNTQSLATKTNQLNVQLATGQKATLYSDFAPDVKNYTSAFDLKSENNQLIDDLGVCQKRLESSEVKIRTISQKLDEFRVQLTQVLDPTSLQGATGFNKFCSDALQSIQTTLNSKDLEGDNLFGGNKTSGAACDMSKLPTFALGQGPSYDYALGDDTRQQIGDLSPFGVTAFDQGLAQAIQCLKIGADNVPNSDASSPSMQMLRQCMGNAAEASKSLSETLGSIGTDQKKMNDQVEELKKSNTYLDENLANIMDIDPLKVHVETVKLQTEMSLANYSLKQMLKATTDLLDMLR